MLALRSEPLAQARDQVFQVGRQRGFDPQGLAANRVNETQAPAREAPAAGTAQGSGPAPSAVDRISHDRVIDLGEMNPDLMGPSGLEPAGQKARPDRRTARSLRNG